MENFELVGPNGTDINNEFLKQYRDALRNQYDANVSSLKQEKRNADASIMSAANERGMMYSNFPQRAKIQNEANYLKNAADLHTTYQTGLDKLRSNAVGTYNQIKDLEDKIADLNEYASKPKSTDPTNTNPFNNLLGNNNNGTDKYNSDDIKKQQEKLGTNTGDSNSGNGFTDFLSGVGATMNRFSDSSNGVPNIGGLIGNVVSPMFTPLQIIGSLQDSYDYGKKWGWWK